MMNWVFLLGYFAVSLAILFALKRTINALLRTINELALTIHELRLGVATHKRAVELDSLYTGNFR